MNRIIGKMSDWMLGRMVPATDAKAEITTLEWAGCCGDIKTCRFCTAGTSHCRCAVCSDPRCT